MHSTHSAPMGCTMATAWLLHECSDSQGIAATTDNVARLFITGCCPTQERTVAMEVTSPLSTTDNSGVV